MIAGGAGVVPTQRIRDVGIWARTRRQVDGSLPHGGSGRIDTAGQATRRIVAHQRVSHIQVQRDRIVVRLHANVADRKHQVLGQATLHR